MNIIGSDGFTVASRCYFYDVPTGSGNQWAGSPLCNGATELIAELRETADKLAAAGAAPMRYLMGINEPWDKTDADLVHDTDPTVYGVEVWPHIQTAAAALGLHLVSPSTRRGAGEGGEANWMALFLLAVDSGNTTDVDEITTFDIHGYK